MAELRASHNPVVVDNTASPPETDGETTISYRKADAEALWERMPEAGWTRVNVHQRTGLGDEADIAGEYDISLAPGQRYTAVILSFGDSPNSDRPRIQATITVFAVFKRPEDRQLITDHSGGSGGTWVEQAVATSVPTSLVLAGASRSEPRTDSDDIPSLVDPDAVFSEPLGPVEMQMHSFTLTPLVPGHHYYLTVMVADTNGNWEVLRRELDTFKRKVIVKFPRITVFNDGDPHGQGEAEFWFRVSAGDTVQARHTLEEFHRPVMDIDDWTQTGRPYTIGFAYVEFEPQTIPPERTSIWVDSWGTEHDGAFEADEHAGHLTGRKLPLPTGKSENVNGGTFQLDCPVMTVDGDFHYRVDVIFDVSYSP